MSEATKKILCVDDHTDFCELVAAILHDVKVVSAHSMADAIVLATREKFDLYLLDYHLPDGTGLTDRTSDIVGRTELRYRDFVSIVHRYRLDKDGLAIRRNEIDATVGSRATYLLVGYERLNRNIDPSLEDLRDSEEIRVGGRIQFGKFWSAFGSTVIDLTDRNEDPLSLADGFDPVKHRLGIAYEDDCLKLGVTWKRDYQETGDAQAGNSYLLTLAFKNLGR